MLSKITILPGLGKRQRVHNSVYRMQKPEALLFVFFMMGIRWTNNNDSGRSAVDRFTFARKKPDHTQLLSC